MPEGKLFHAARTESSSEIREFIGRECLFRDSLVDGHPHIAMVVLTPYHPSIKEDVEVSLSSNGFTVNIGGYNELR